MTLDLKQFFLNPSTPRQRQYEAIRAIVLENLPVSVVSKKFGYTTATLYSLLRDVKSGKLDLYPQISKGPKSRRIPENIQQLIEKLRLEKCSVEEIREQLVQRGYKVSASTIERILGMAGYSKLPRRTLAQRGKTKAKTEIPERTRALDFTKLAPFNIECPTVGVFFFLPYIIEAGILPIIQHCDLPKSSVINAQQAALSM